MVGKITEKQAGWIVWRITQLRRDHQDLKLALPDVLVPGANLWALELERRLLGLNRGLASEIIGLLAEAQTEEQGIRLFLKSI